MSSCDFLNSCQNKKKSKEKSESGDNEGGSNRKKSKESINNKEFGSNKEKSKNLSPKIENNDNIFSKNLKSKSNEEGQENMNNYTFKNTNFNNSKVTHNIIPEVDENVKSNLFKDKNSHNTLIYDKLADQELQEQVPNSNSSNDQSIKRKKSIIDEQIFEELKLLVKNNRKVNRQKSKNQNILA